MSCVWLIIILEYSSRPLVEHRWSPQIDPKVMLNGHSKAYTIDNRANYHCCNIDDSQKSASKRHEMKGDTHSSSNRLVAWWTAVWVWNDDDWLGARLQVHFAIDPCDQTIYWSVIEIQTIPSSPVQYIFDTQHHTHSHDNVWMMSDGLRESWELNIFWLEQCSPV